MTAPARSVRWGLGLAVLPVAAMVVMALRGSPPSQRATATPAPEQAPRIETPERAAASEPAAPPRPPAPPVRTTAAPAVHWEQPGAHFDGDAVLQAQRVWDEESVDPATAPVREARVRDLFDSVDFGRVLLGIECRTSLCRIALDPQLTQDFDRMRRLAGRVGRHAAVLERTPERIVVLVPGESFDHDTPPRRIPGEDEPPPVMQEAREEG
jgi:hypothetical protein